MVYKYLIPTGKGTLFCISLLSETLFDKFIANNFTNMIARINYFITLHLDDISWYLRFMAENLNLGIGQGFNILYIYSYLLKLLKY
jgi:hypothetical protein